MFLWYVPSPHLYDNGERTGALLSLSGRSESRRWECRLSFDAMERLIQCGRVRIAALEARLDALVNARPREVGEMTCAEAGEFLHRWLSWLGVEKR